MTRAPFKLAYSPAYLDADLGRQHPMQPIRSQIATDALQRISKSLSWDLETLEPEWSEERFLATADLVHDEDYLREVLTGKCPEWTGSHPEVARAAALSFLGTVDLVQEMERSISTSGVYFSSQGAQHHAMRDHSSGFCVFNDFAYAAARLARQGFLVSYIDWDAHHGDGVEALTRDLPLVQTHSIHDSLIFPGTGHESMPSSGVFNYPLPEGSGDDELLSALGLVLDRVSYQSPDVIILATGADGLADDPLSTLRYTLDGFYQAASVVGELAAELGAPVLIGGAGGYLPEHQTPEVWGVVTARIYDQILDSLKETA